SPREAVAALRAVPLQGEEPGGGGPGRAERPNASREVAEGGGRAGPRPVGGDAGLPPSVQPDGPLAGLVPLRRARLQRPAAASSARLSGLVAGGEGRGTFARLPPWLGAVSVTLYGCARARKEQSLADPENGWDLAGAFGREGVWA